MKYKPYDSYKDSGVEWIGDIPEGWEVKKLKYVCSVNDDALPEDTPADFEMRYVDIGSVTFEKGIIEYQEILFENSPSRARRLVKNGDVIVSTVRTYLKAIAGIKDDKDVIVSTGFAVVRPKKIFENYLNYVVRNPYFVETVSANSVGVSYPAINALDMMCIEIAYPKSEDKQIVISNYLDTETARIASIISAKQKLIEKLKEKRSAIISHAVTKGLDPNAKMKPSGIDWIGDIPDKWEVKRLKNLALIISKGTTPSTIGKDISNDGEVRFIKAENIKDNLVSINPEFFIDKETDELLSRSKLSENDILFVIAGATIGKVAILNKKSLPANTNQAISFIRLKNHQNHKFVWFFLQSNLALEQIRLVSVQSAQPNISMENLGNLLLPHSSLETQTAIADYLDIETAKIDDIIEKTKTSIEKLNEYKTALISACVTGKIDVRGGSNIQANE